MSVNFKYTTPPTLTSNSLGYLAVNTTFNNVAVAAGAGYVDVVTFTLPAGTYIYSVCGTISCNNVTVSLTFNGDTSSIVIASGSAFAPYAQNIVIQPTALTTYKLQSDCNGSSGFVGYITGRVNVIRIA